MTQKSGCQRVVVVELRKHCRQLKCWRRQVRECPDVLGQAGRLDWLPILHSEPFRRNRQQVLVGALLFVRETSFDLVRGNPQSEEGHLDLQEGEGLESKGALVHQLHLSFFANQALEIH